MHVAEQHCNGFEILVRCLFDDLLVFVEELNRAVDELVELLLVYSQNFPNHVELLALLVRFSGKSLELGNIAHTQHQALAGVVIVADG